MNPYGQKTFRALSGDYDLPSMVTTIDADDAIRKFGIEADRIMSKARMMALPVIIGSAALGAALLYFVLASAKKEK